MPTPKPRRCCWQPSRSAEDQCDGSLAQRGAWRRSPNPRAVQPHPRAQLGRRKHDLDDEAALCFGRHRELGMMRVSYRADDRKPKAVPRVMSGTRRCPSRSNGWKRRAIWSSPTTGPLLVTDTNAPALRRVPVVVTSRRGRRRRLWRIAFWTSDVGQQPFDQTWIAVQRGRLEVTVAARGQSRRAHALRSRVRAGRRRRPSRAPPVRTRSGVPLDLASG